MQEQNSKLETIYEREEARILNSSTDFPDLNLFRTSSFVLIENNKDMLYSPYMWPFRRKEKKKKNMVKQVITGVIIGAAISSIIGKTMLDKHEEDKDGNED